MENINYPAPKQEYKVLVRCFTFNHSKYIEDALNGFAMQQTNFPFVCLVVDDASTDGEQEVIKAWMEHECDMSNVETIDIPTSIVKIVPHKNNPSCSFAFYLLKQNLYRTKEKKIMHITPWRDKCEYEAICEGDDFWIDPYKLQKQINFLNENNDYGMCYTKAQIYNQNLSTYDEDTIGVDFNLFEELLLSNKIPTLTAVYRINLYLQYIKEIKPYARNWKMGDYPMWLWFAANCKIKFIDEITATYRVLENSASHFLDLDKKEQFLSSVKDIRLFFHSKYSKKNILITTINDIFHRECMINGEISNERIYSLNHLKSIINKRKKDYIKLFLYHIKIGFLLTKYINLLRL